MEALIPYAIWTVIILVGLALLVLIIFGLRSVFYGKISPISILIVVLPIILLLVLGFTTGDWTYSAILMVLIMLGVGALALLLSGMRSMVS